jgi:hypothetical protein
MPALLLGTAALCGIAYLYARAVTRPAPIDDRAYFHGAIYSHNGDLVTEDGRTLKKAALPTPKRPR